MKRHVIAGAAALAGILALAIAGSHLRSGIPAQAQSGSTLEENKALVRQYLAAVAGGDRSALTDLVTPSFVDHQQRLLATSVMRSPPSGSGGPPAGTVITLNPSDAVIDLMVAEGDLIAVHSTAAGPSGETGVEFFDIFRIENGRVAEHWGGAGGAPAIRMPG